ncbi:hypothetical protein ADN00_14535 [Ornatilinea apprima]|uniref:Uncharacterized protein n=1 Tax=Ornatilinea apprima TaxID=1134406 RepID=A0A0P6X242_9CHLR|nr:gamma-glutamyl-gamma-aminobutyrate hydrolase family protein [Ornatilinea apprima]KPL73558.1 hypothetical protein ADN00_14535 [Ornatilinea apprima]
MNPTPLIGLTVYRKSDGNGHWTQSLADAYGRAVIRAGAMPVLLPTQAGLDAAVLMERLDGLLLTGGGDMHPEVYGLRPHARVGSVDLLRDQIEVALVHAALQAGKPLLGICRGAQVLNVALGGDLFTDIADQTQSPIRHDCYDDLPRDHLAHGLRVLPGSRLHAALGVSETQVNSLHHQAVDRLGEGLKAVAWSPDGLVEGVEMDGEGFVVGAQWHPECLPEAQAMQALFAAFVNAAAQSGG